MKIMPFDDRVAIVINEEEEEKKEGGLLLPPTAKNDEKQTGTVLAVGSGETIKEMVKVGDTVLFNKYGGTGVEVDGKKILILGSEDLLALIS